MQHSLPFLIETPPETRGRERKILLEGRLISYRLRRSSRRTIGISVDENGLQAAAPRWVSIAEVEAFIVEKRRWVLRHLSDAKRRIKPPFVWHDGAQIPYLGGELRIRVTADEAVQLQGELLQVGLGADFSAAALRKKTIAWLKAQALTHFEPRVQEFAARLRVPPPGLGLSQARTQWGNCARKPDGSTRVLLNWKLMHYEATLIDYVVAHELAHLRHMNHSAAFWREVERLYPDYLEARRQLRERAHWAPEL